MIEEDLVSGWRRKSASSPSLICDMRILPGVSFTDTFFQNLFCSNDLGFSGVARRLLASFNISACDFFRAIGSAAAGGAGCGGSGGGPGAAGCGRGVAPRCGVEEIDRNVVRGTFSVLARRRRSSLGPRSADFMVCCMVVLVIDRLSDFSTFAFARD